MTSLTLGLIAAFCWGLHDITIRYLSRSAPMMGCLLAVLFVGAIFQAIALGFRGAGEVTGDAWALSALSGIFFLSAMVGLYFAFARGPVRLVSPIVASLAVVAVAIALFEGATFTLAQGAAILILMIGITIVAVATPEDDQKFPPIGPTIGFAVLSACSFAATFRLGQLAAEASSDLAASLISRLTALIVLGLVLVIGKSTIWPGRAAILPLIGMGLLDSIAIFAVIAAAPLPNPEYAAVASSIFGLLTIVLAWALLKEAMSNLQWLGCVIAFAAIGYLAL